MLPKFSIRNLLFTTTATALAVLVCRASQLSVSGCFMGLLCFWIGGGLTQQLFEAEPSNRSALAKWSRKYCLIVILVAILTSVLSIALASLWKQYRLGVFGRAVNTHVLQAWDLAQPVCLMALLLGALTSRGLGITPSKPTNNRRQVFSMFLNLIAIVALLLSFAILLNSDITIIALVDMGIDWIMLANNQAASQGTEFFEPEIARPHGLFRRAVRIQLWTWPWLIIAMVHVSATLKRTLSHRTLICNWLFTFLLCLPSLANVWWLAQGAARTLSPQAFLLIGELPQPHWLSMFLLFQMLTIYFVSRGVPVRIQCEERFPEARSSGAMIDQYVIGLFFVGLGIARSIEMLSQLYGLRWWYLGLQELLQVPEFVAHLALIFFGIYWIWKRWRSRKLPTMERWPQFDTAQLTYAPLVFCLVVGIVVLCVPFGVALLHAGL